jgi:hypothetical protein
MTRAAPCLWRADKGPPADPPMILIELPSDERDKRDLGILNRNALRLNQEAAEVLTYQVIPCRAETSVAQPI